MANHADGTGVRATSARTRSTAYHAADRARSPVGSDIDGRQGATISLHVDRRRSVMAAAVAIASLSGYDGVKMRDLAAASGISLVTLYRTFPSKDALLMAAMVARNDAFVARTMAQPLIGETPADRLCHILRAACRPLERNENLTAAFARAMNSPSPEVGVHLERLESQLQAVLTLPIDDLEGDARRTVLLVLARVWHSALGRWMSGRGALTDVAQELQATARFLLARDAREVAGQISATTRSG